METILEISVGLILVVGLCWFMFDIDFKKILVVILFILSLIASGIFIGIGIHATNLIFGW